MYTVRQILRRKGHEVFSVDPEARVLDALALMARHDVGALLVRDRSGVILGMFSERDYARKVILRGKSSREIAVREVMSSRVISVSPAESVDRCMAMMTELRTRHLPVLEGPELVGLVSIGDVVKALLEEKDIEIEQLSGYIYGTP